MTLTALVLKTLSPWLALIFSTAHTAHVDPHTLGAIVYLESRGQPHLVSKERNGSCSVGLGMVNVPDCDPMRISALQDPAFNLRAAAVALRANQRWCRKHPSEWRCRAGNRAFPGGGGVNCYAGNTKSYAPKVAEIRRVLRRSLDPDGAALAATQVLDRSARDLSHRRGPRPRRHVRGPCSLQDVQSSNHKIDVPKGHPVDHRQGPSPGRVCISARCRPKPRGR